MATRPPGPRAGRFPDVYKRQVYEFDTQNRWVKRTAGNGRLTERELMCDGGLLWEIDENGIRTCIRNSSDCLVN